MAMHPGHHFGRIFVALGARVNRLGHSWALLGALEAHMGLSMLILEPPGHLRVDFEVIWDQFWSMLASLLVEFGEMAPEMLETMKSMTLTTLWGVFVLRSL